MGEKQLEFYNHPHYEYTVDVALIDEDIELGDSAYIIDTEMSPELYLEARAIEVQISQSDYIANKVVFGDFIEIDVVKPSSIWALESLASQALEKANAASSWKVELFTPEGTDFENMTDKKSIIARVYDGMTNITYDLEQASFVWQMTDVNGVHNEEWENAHIGIGNVIEVGQEVAGYTITCSVDTVTAETPLFFALEQDFFFFSKLENNNSNTEDLNVKVVQYAVVEPVNQNIYWSQIYEGSKLTAADIAKGESYSITRTGMNGLIIDRMEIKNGGHGSHFALNIENNKVMVYAQIKDVDNDTAYACKFPYRAETMIDINDVSVVKLAETMARVNADFKNNYYLFVDGSADSIRFRINTKEQIENEGRLLSKYILNASDFLVQENQIYQSSTLDFPYLYVTFGGTNGTANNGDTPVLYCIDVRSSSVVYQINYTFTTDAIVPEDDHHEAETISCYYDLNGQKWLVQGFAFTNDDEALLRRNNCLYRVRETFRT
ncbi:phage tail protein [Rummeliibacillus suwonensis]|uniref:phage baseplate protein n=1 Tax=Rummeliibacillus suwonensis TaxID=1306154 RepID=UPI0011B4EDC7|nr:phage tail protein [Rummeliibacillus suwonensis]